MSEGLLGVVIGGILASFGTILTLIIENNRWKKEKRIEYLKDKKEKLDESYTKAISELNTALNEDNFPIDLVNNFRYQYPDGVANEFWKIFDDKDKSVENKKRHYWKICEEMKKSIVSIDTEIDRIILGKSK